MPLGLTDPAGLYLSQYLDARSEAPIAVGFSGGSDSLAVLVATLAFAKPLGRPVLAMTVDHDLQAQSRAWTDDCAKIASRLGAEPVALIWRENRPSGDSGLTALARQARHRLLARAARQHGARVLVLGHTRNDRAEADWMRSRGANLGQLRAWSPSPVWPEGRGLFVLRPLLESDREDLKAALEAQGLKWISDPANLDLRYMRSRARQALSLDPQAPETIAGPMPYWPTALGGLGHLGALMLDRKALQAAPRGVAAFLARALLCVSGSVQPVRSDRLGRLEARLRGQDVFAATLSGVRLMADAQTVWMVREGARAGEQAHYALQDGVWDGRFEIEGLDEGQSLAPLKGHAAALSRADRVWLQTVPARARPTLPVGLTGGLVPILPWFIGPNPPPLLGKLAAKSLMIARLKAACGQVFTERNLMIDA